MIVQLICDSIYNLVNSLLVFSIPVLSNTFFDSFGRFITYVSYGIDIYAFFVPPFANYLLTIVLVIKTAVDLYFLITWVIKKIPMLNIS